MFNNDIINKMDIDELRNMVVKLDSLVYSDALVINVQHSLLSTYMGIFTEMRDLGAYENERDHKLLTATNIAVELSSKYSQKTEGETNG